MTKQITAVRYSMPVIVNAAVDFHIYEGH